MTDAILLPADTGDEIAQCSLSWARRSAAEARDRGWTMPNPGMVSYFAGKLDTAELYLRADRDLVMGAENEIRFLLGDYSRGVAA